MHETAFIDAVLQAPVQVLGLTLRPYALGHEILLVRQRNPLVILTGSQFTVFSEESQRRAVQNAVLVCYRTWAQNQRPEKNVRFWKWRVERMFDHGQAIIDFLRYRAAGMTAPPAPTDHALLVLSKNKDDDSGRFLGGPFLARLYTFIARLPDREIRQFGETAFDFPMGFGTFLYKCHLEQKGCLQIENEQEAEVEKEYQQAIANVPAERRLA